MSLLGVSKEMDDDLQDMIKRMKAVVEEETKKKNAGKQLGKKGVETSKNDATTGLTAEQVAWIKNPSLDDMDDDHIYDIHVDASHFLDWFAAKPDKEAVEDWNGESEIDYEGDEAEFEFEKFDDETILITHPVPLWWCDPEVDRGALEEAILEKLFLKKEWVKSFACNG